MLSMEVQSCVQIASEEKMVLVNQIAFPFEAPPSFAAGVKFFSRLRDLTLTGYYTSKDGLKDIGYVGNTPNFWDGVPQDVLEKYGFELDAQYKDLYITEAKRNDLAKWDSTGNLIG